MLSFCPIIAYALVIISISFSSRVNAVSDEMQLDHVEIVNSTQIFNISSVRITRSNHTTYVLNAEMDSMAKVSQNHEIEANFYFIRSNNQHYTKSVMKITRRPYCAMMQKFIPLTPKNTTNIFNQEEMACPLNKVSK